jgi:hypothetical protein
MRPSPSRRLYEALEERTVKYAIRLPASDNLQRNITELLTRPVGRPSYKPVVRHKSFLYQAGSWEAGAAGGGEGRVPLRGAVPPREVHCDQSWDFKPGGGAFLQQAWHPVAERHRLQLGQPMATAGAARANREVVADQLAAAVDETRWAFNKACTLYWLLLA